MLEFHGCRVSWLHLSADHRPSEHTIASSIVRTSDMRLCSHHLPVVIVWELDVIFPDMTCGLSDNHNWRTTQTQMHIRRPRYWTPYWIHVGQRQIRTQIELLGCWCCQDNLVQIVEMTVDFSWSRPFAKLKNTLSVGETFLFFWHLLSLSGLKECVQDTTSHRAGFYPSLINQ